MEKTNSPLTAEIIAATTTTTTTITTQTHTHATTTTTYPVDPDKTSLVVRTGPFHYRPTYLSRQCFNNLKKKHIIFLQNTSFMQSNIVKVPTLLNLASNMTSRIRKSQSHFWSIMRILNGLWSTWFNSPPPPKKKKKKNIPVKFENDLKNISRGVAQTSLVIRTDRQMDRQTDRQTRATSISFRP